MTDKEKIRAEVERRIGMYETSIDISDKIRFVVCTEILSLIDSLNETTQEEKESLLKDLEWIDMETNECHCYNCELFDRKNNNCKDITLCKNPKRTYKGFYIK